MVKYRNFQKKLQNYFSKKNTYNKTLRNINIIKTKIPRLGYNIDPYVRNIQLGNIQNKSIHNSIANELKKIHIHPVSSTKLRSVRMNDMGYNLFDINQNTELQTRLLTNVPLLTIVKEMKRVSETVKDIYNADYIHGDIHENNVLCNVETGELRIIDFDFLKPIDTITRNDFHLLQFRPVESYIIKNANGILSIIEYMCNTKDINIDFLDSEYMLSILTSHINEHYSTIIFLLTQNLDPEDTRGRFEDLVQDYKKGIWELVSYVRSNVRDINSRLDKFLEIINKYYKETCDLYGLGLAFLFYINGILRHNTLNNDDIVFNGGVQQGALYIEILSSINKISFNMFSPNFIYRFRIDRVIDEFGELIKNINFIKKRNNIMLNRNSRSTTRRIKKLAPML